MLIACPSCRRQLETPDDAGARHVRCPSCQHIFAAQAAAGAEQIQTAPAPLPPARDDDELPRRRERDDDDGALTDLGPAADRERYRDDDDFLRDDDGEARHGETRHGEALQRARAAARWFFAAAGVTMALTTADLVKSVTIGEVAQMPLAGPERDIALAVIAVVAIGCGGVLLALNVLIIIAGIKLRSLGAKGWVATGIVLAFVQVVLFAISALTEVVTVLFTPDEAMARWIPLSIAFDAISGTMNLVAGIKGIVTLNNAAVSSEFERHRRLRLPRYD